MVRASLAGRQSGCRIRVIAMQVRRARILALAIGLLAAGCVTGGSHGDGPPSDLPTDSAVPSGSAMPSPAAR